MAYLMKWNRIAWSIGFNSWTNWTLWDVIPRSLWKIRFNDVSEMFNCWERRWIDVDGASNILWSHNSNILRCTYCFWLFTLWFIDGNASFFHFFHKITNIRSWRCFSSSKIRTQFSYIFYDITMIFKVMSQYFPGQAYTQLYSFGERKKLIICQITLECYHSRNKQ